mgnify:CR=1 FL=1
MSETMQFVTWCLGTLATLSVVIGLAVRFILVPYLRENLVKPMAETHHSVTQNGGKNNPPTIPDQMHAMRKSLDELGRKFDDHLSVAADDQQRLASVEGQVEVLRDRA